MIGTGADLVYPTVHHALAAQIAARGAIVSEWPLGTPARSANFPQRNGVIAALVEGVVVIEAAMRSGSLITARLANEMGRDVFALPGSIHAPLTRGCHRLIKQGAQLVETPEEVLEALGFLAPMAAAAAAKTSRAPAKKREKRGSEATRLPPTRAANQIALPLDPTPHAEPPARPPAPDRLDADARTLLAALGHAPATLEILAQRTDMAEALLQATLLRLELAGHVSALPGGWFARASHC
ncbi:hypothetical protein PSP6_460001 [Paraburkholderia tropica]|nr:hypothetical protein PSP6_460001 [Paraburkholderia tropica]